ncbi:HEPN domain protein (plasmid) [Neomoorella glycerini]|uniref:HEPN domain protein n=1 Tax=Neomoorella glycerini TaxID=55779 RepID=A0A6I5ZWQ5_9FIRM|nr:HEPN domain-containing protein [Moorella glycerini]QGP94139.1 HEPN domain protein [Moorella glycerini]
MNSSEREQEALKWQDRARRDLRVAKMLFYDKEPEFDLACYLSQQCAEKSLKALLIRLGIRFAYKHDLDYLVGLLPPEEQEKFYNTRLEWLSGWVTEGRYPGDAAGATREDAQNAIEIAEAIYNNVSNALRSK